MKKSSSSVAAGLKLKTEQADGGSRQGSGGVNCLELRLGISSDNGSSPWRVDPWSLAARQEKASLEKQAHQRPDECDLQRENDRTAAPSHQPVGWPPVRAFRKNLSSASKPDDGFLLSNNKEKPCSEDDDHGCERPAMFVKVNLEGCAVGRKVDLQAHRGYASLSRALQSMFHGFLLSDAQWRIASSPGNNTDKLDEDDYKEQHEQQQVETKKKTYILLYEDNEGDRMLVGDVPWELFVASVKRLYIAQDTRTRATPVS
ncbi:hypothetical protein PR202_gb29029 [Eleusine coracana subsp. coracana]|uniref:Auxin-responsive protein n=1 Tax=Eleusine coracana subsp. coracana TaxID=191504 RepID=A0AAV5FW55_ELECO|nr:hypothetical protein QOZ80_8BG0642350 [Eleusine coracana subsp. coracana]GJN39879.1 hypothetical protein PR202_gb29029 [Eleusine coracana subsp. coracana]